MNSKVIKDDIREQKEESVLQEGGSGPWSVVDRSWKVEKVSRGKDVGEIKKLSHGLKKKKGNGGHRVLRNDHHERGHDNT